MIMIKIIVPGGLYTDIIASKVSKIASRGELVIGEELKIGPGGKSRNIAQMTASLVDKGAVAMIGKTTKDPFGLWKVPYEALAKAGVDVGYVKVLEFTGIFPAVALVPVDQNGNNQIYVLPGINNSFGPEDIDRATLLFEEAKANSGIVGLSMELPLNTALYILDKAREYGLRVVLDPGGIQEGIDYQPLLSKDIFLLKPNQHEAEILSGIKVLDLESAKQSGEVLRRFGVENVLITAGVDGAYLISESSTRHIPIPEIKYDSLGKDETGCGDQTTATICAFLSEGKSVLEAVKAGVIAGTLQFYKSGIVPVGREELLPYLHEL